MQDQPITCSLRAGELRERLRDIAEVGADSLIEAGAEGGAHLLRFRSDARTRRELERIVAAEGECCAFLDLDLRAEGGDLILRIAAPSDARPVADELALAFAGRAD